MFNLYFLKELRLEKSNYDFIAFNVTVNLRMYYSCL
jgi:tRNA(Ile)-lysidine synthase TilS/MesJ